MMRLVTQLSNKEKYVIAEFLFAMESDTLMKSEGQAVIDLFRERLLENSENIKLETFSIYNAIKKEIDFSERQKMMEDYFAGKLG